MKKILIFIALNLILATFIILTCCTPKIECIKCDEKIPEHTALEYKSINPICAKCYIKYTNILGAEKNQSLIILTFNILSIYLVNPIKYPIAIIFWIIFIYLLLFPLLFIYPIVEQKKRAKYEKRFLKNNNLSQKSNQLLTYLQKRSKRSRIKQNLNIAKVFLIWAILAIILILLVMKAISHFLTINKGALFIFESSWSIMLMVLVSLVLLVIFTIIFLCIKGKYVEITANRRAMRQRVKSKTVIKKFRRENEQSNL